MRGISTERLLHWMPGNRAYVPKPPGGVSTSVYRKVRAQLFADLFRRHGTLYSYRATNRLQTAITKSLNTAFGPILEDEVLGKRKRDWNRAHVMVGRLPNWDEPELMDYGAEELTPSELAQIHMAKRLPKMIQQARRTGGGAMHRVYQEALLVGVPAQAILRQMGLTTPPDAKEDYGEPPADLLPSLKEQEASFRTAVQEALSKPVPRSTIYRLHTQTGMSFDDIARRVRSLPSRVYMRYHEVAREVNRRDRLQRFLDGEENFMDLDVRLLGEFPSMTKRMLERSRVNTIVDLITTRERHLLGTGEAGLKILRKSLKRYGLEMSR